MSDIPTEVLRCPVHGIPDCSPLLNGCSIPIRLGKAYEAGRAAAVEGDTIDGYCGFCGQEGHASRDCTALDGQTEDTLPQWLYWRFGDRPIPVTAEWDDLPEDQQDYWRHEAAAVRRAVARGGFKGEGRADV